MLFRSLGAPSITTRASSMTNPESVDSIGRKLDNFTNVLHAKRVGMKDEEKHLWYRVALGDTEIGILNMENFDMSNERIVPIEEAPEWMMEKIALLKLSGSKSEGLLAESLGGRVGDVFYIRKE